MIANVPIIDTHVHLYSHKDAMNLAWMRPDLPLCGEFGPKRYMAKAAHSLYTVDKVVFVEVDTKSDAQDQVRGWDGPVHEYEYLCNVPEQHNLIGAMILWAPLTAGVAATESYIQRLRSTNTTFFSKVRGFRYLVQDKPPGTMNEPRFIEAVQWLGDQGFLFEVGVDFHRRGGKQLEELEQLLRQCPATTMVLNHLCKPAYQAQTFDQWKDHMARVRAAHDQSYMKISGGLTELEPPVVADIDALAAFFQPYVQHVVALWGLDRVIWGSDWPVCTMGVAEGLDAWQRVCDCIFTNLGWTEADKAKVFGENARRVYIIKSI